MLIQTMSTNGVHYLYNTRITGTVIGGTNGLSIGDNFTALLYDVDMPVIGVTMYFKDEMWMVRVEFNEGDVELIDTITELVITELKP